jgi:hypothetical protein
MVLSRFSHAFGDPETGRSDLFDFIVVLLADPE